MKLFCKLLFLFLLLPLSLIAQPQVIFDEYFTDKTMLIPNPKSKIVFSLERRDEKNQLYSFYSDTIDPGSVNIIRQEFSDPDVQIFRVKENGNPHKKVDVVILAEGYSVNDKEKFLQHVNQVANIFFNQEPFKSNESNFNIYGVFKPSSVSGISEPRAGIYKKTALSATFNSLNSERYILTEDNKSMRDLAAHVPYDAIYIMINHNRYGGGGIYNLFCTFTAANQSLKYLLIHEFGHSFAGLADEYYGSPVAYTDLIPQNLEPLEPNVTALSDHQNLKWKQFIEEGTALPTQWNKKEYDRVNFSWQKLRKSLNSTTSKLKRTGASAAEINAAEEDYDEKHNAAQAQLEKILQEDPSSNLVGAFEGAGYSSEGLYRPMLDCIMFSVGKKTFCMVCEHAIKKVIDHYLEE